eukprot:CAMPEP_0196775184 /NCGR_PEP_ID=MMETSP1104-20130614/3876_1 /TAXON_ID=33652 /ORGANISM="Cafeteria sp., Strain Caron Lab Isolate" /LENGTH=148 /DNA_ID=CAMNT_0042145351 /DNA_START=44 /DNA_END=487 /DNA_ORIENTATION=+
MLAARNDPLATVNTTSEMSHASDEALDSLAAAVDAAEHTVRHAWGGWAPLAAHCELLPECSISGVAEVNVDRSEESEAELSVLGASRKGFCRSLVCQLRESPVSGTHGHSKPIAERRRAHSMVLSAVAVDVPVFLSVAVIQLERVPFT